MNAKVKLSRRQVLGLGVGGAAGAAAIRLFGFHTSGSSPLASAAGSGGAWTSPLGDSRALAAHLLRRSGFGYSSADLDTAAAMSYSDLVDKIVNQQPDALPKPANIINYTSIAQAWISHMAATQSQFPERMAFFWHGHLTSDYRKSVGLPLVYQQNQLYRAAGRGDLRSLLVKTTADPLMMRYLDLDQSTAAAPNENFSRELMELYTLGAGNYSEADVREGARAFSGMRIVVVDAGGKPVTPPKRTTSMTIQDYYAQLTALANSGAVWKGELSTRQHDSGSKTFLGRTGNLTPTDAIDTILAQDACATFIANKALQYFATPNPSTALVSSVASQFRSSQYDIKTLMRAIFTSSDFKDAGNYRSLVRSPVDVVVATMRALNRPDLAQSAVAAGPTMDQILYDPPTVAGWPVNGSWLSSTSVLARLNFAALTVQNQKTFPSPGDAVKNQLDNTVGPDLASVYNASQSDGDKWYALLSSPEFHLK